MSNPRQSIVLGIEVNASPAGPAHGVECCGEAVCFPGHRDSSVFFEEGTYGFMGMVFFICQLGSIMDLS